MKKKRGEFHHEKDMEKACLLNLNSRQIVNAHSGGSPFRLQFWVLPLISIAKIVVNNLVCCGFCFAQISHAHIITFIAN